MAVFLHSSTITAFGESENRLMAKFQSSSVLSRFDSLFRFWIALAISVE